MMSNNVIEALYIFDEHNNPILQHTYRSRPPGPKTLISLYLSHPAPQPSLIYLPNVNPPTTLFSIEHSNLLFLSPSTTDTEPLFVLEYLHRVTDVLEEFLGAPLISNKIENAYDIVEQLLESMCDGGEVCNTEPNALRDYVEVPGFIGKFLGGVGLPGTPPSLSSNHLKTSSLSFTSQPQAPTVPWRRSNVKHTSNEIYVDIVESLSITLAPSGRTLAALASGSIAFTSKISGVPDLTLVLTAAGGRSSIIKALDLPVFHPCVRLARWRSNPGELSFVPPDGRFVLVGYEADLLAASSTATTISSTTSLSLPATLAITTSLGPSGADFEARLTLSHTFPAFSANSRGNSISGTGSTTTPLLSPITVNIPLPSSVRSVPSLRASRGDAHWTPGDTSIEWRVEPKDALFANGRGGGATLRVTLSGPSSLSLSSDPACLQADENEEPDQYQDQDGLFSSPLPTDPKPAKNDDTSTPRDNKLIEFNKKFMPTSATLSFDVKGWLASGIRVESLTVDTRRSRGLGEGVRPYKGVKYLTVSRRGVECRC